MRIKKWILFIFVSLFLITGCNNQEDKENIYYLNEKVQDNAFEMVLNDISTTNHFQDVEPENDTYLMLEFKITNLSDEKQMIPIDHHFVLKIDNSNYEDLNHNKDTEIDAKESVMYKVVYDVPEKDFYEIIYNIEQEDSIKFSTK